jgi:hypothetical protein
MRKDLRDRLARYFGECALCAARPQFFTFAYEGDAYRVSFTRAGETVACEPCAPCAHELCKIGEFQDSDLFAEIREDVLKGTRRVRASWVAYALTL